MGAKDWMFVWTDGDAADILRGKPPLDREAALGLATRLYPGRSLTPLGEGTLAEQADPGEGEVWLGAFPGLTIACTDDAARDHPAEAAGAVHALVPARYLYVHAMHSVVDWFAFTQVERGEVRRSLSLSPDSGIMEDLGTPLPFEAPYWGGEHPVEVDDDEDAYPLPFHPLELAEVVMEHLLGFQFEGSLTDVDPFEVPVIGYRLDGG